MVLINIQTKYPPFKTHVTNTVVIVLLNCLVPRQQINNCNDTKIIFKANENEVQKAGQDNKGKFYACFHEMSDSVVMQRTKYTKCIYLTFIMHHLTQVY